MKVLVYGFYRKKNLGDNFFIEAYKNIFPEYKFTFTEKITEELFNSNDAVFFGGGSFLDGQPSISSINLLEKLPSKPLFYIGVGAETNINLWHKFLLKKANLVFIRSSQYLDKIRELNKNTFLCSDLVYALSSKVKFGKIKSKSILYLPNSHIISKWNDAAWKHSAWEYFKSEYSQAFEELINKDYSIDVFPMCHNSYHKDDRVAVELANKMRFGELKILDFKEHDFPSLSELISSYELIISQRYHGLVIADITKTPCINIHHHDKLKNFSGTMIKNIDYYRSSKETILKTIDEILFVKSLSGSDNNISINSDDFKSLREKVNCIIKKD